MSTQPSQHEAPGLSPAQRALLQKQTVGTDGPGTILRDFETLLRFVGERDVPVSGVHQVLPLALLPELNARMTRPLVIRLQRPQMKSFPNLAGLYLLLRAGGLSHVENAGKRRLLRPDPQALEAWRRLNPTEQYFTLLEIWLLRSDEEILGERDPFMPIDKVALFLRWLPPEGAAITGPGEEEGLRYYPGLHNLALLEAFGLLDITHGEPEPSRGWRVERVALALGDAVLALLAHADPRLGSMRLKRDNAASLLDLFAASLSEPPAVGEIEDDDPAGDAEDEQDEAQEPPFGQWQSLFQPLFPEWRANFALPGSAPTEGIYVFKVSLGRVWRRIAIPSHSVLDDLSEAILQAFEFDNDHLYRFSFRNRFGATVDVNHPYLDEPPFTTEVTIGELPLRPGDTMIFVFDFGDYWEFAVALERLDPPDARVKKPRLLESHGKAPEQYPDWDDAE